MNTTGRSRGSSSSTRISVSIAAVAPEPQNRTTSVRAPVHRAVDDAPRLLPQRCHVPAGGRRLGVRVGVQRQHLIADVVLDERRARGRRRCSRRTPAAAARTAHPAQHRRRSPSRSANPARSGSELRHGMSSTARRLALPGADQQRPQHGPSGKRSASRAKSASNAADASSVVMPCADRGRQQRWCRRRSASGGRRRAVRAARRRRCRRVRRCRPARTAPAAARRRARRSRRRVNASITTRPLARRCRAPAGR